MGKSKKSEVESGSKSESSDPFEESDDQKKKPVNRKDMKKSHSIFNPNLKFGAANKLGKQGSNDSVSKKRSSRRLSKGFTTDIISEKLGDSDDSDVPNALAKKVAQEDDERKDQSRNLIKKIK